MIAMTNEAFNLADYYPDATAWGKMGATSIAAERFTCNLCGCHEEAIIWQGFKVIDRKCWDCLLAGENSIQLSLLAQA